MNGTRNFFSGRLIMAAIDSRRVGEDGLGENVVRNAFKGEQFHRYVLWRLLSFEGKVPKKCSLAINVPKNVIL